MDMRNKALDYTNMKSIPTYALYGESESSGESWLHWETITSRSRLHGFRISAHRHDQLYQILYLRSGTAQVMFDGDWLDVSPPALIVVPPLTVHSFVFSPNVEGVVLTFFAQEIRSALEQIGGGAEGLVRPRILFPVDTVVDSQEMDHAVSRLIAEADRGATGQVAALRARLVLLLVAACRLDLAAAMRAADRRDASERRIHDFLALVDAHFRDTRRVDFYAARVGITPTHLNRLCRQELGLTALAAIERRILLEAQRYLQFSSLSIKEIGIVLGYPDPAYFSRFISRRLGQGPQALRERLSRRGRA